MSNEQLELDLLRMKVLLAKQHQAAQDALRKAEAELLACERDIDQIRGGGNQEPPEPVYVPQHTDPEPTPPLTSVATPPVSAPEPAPQPSQPPKYAIQFQRPAKIADPDEIDWDAELTQSENKWVAAFADHNTTIADRIACRNHVAYARICYRNRGRFAIGALEIELNKCKEQEKQFHTVRPKPAPKVIVTPGDRLKGPNGQGYIYGPDGNPVYSHYKVAKYVGEQIGAATDFKLNVCDEETVEAPENAHH